MLGSFAKPPLHCQSPGVASRTPAIAIAQTACDVHNDDNDNAWQRGPLWSHGMGPMTQTLQRKCDGVGRCTQSWQDVSPLYRQTYRGRLQVFTAKLCCNDVFSQKFVTELRRVSAGRRTVTSGEVDSRVAAPHRATNCVDPGRRYVVPNSPDLFTWTRLTTLYGGGGFAAERVSHSDFQFGRFRKPSAHLLGESWPTDHWHIY